MQEIVFKIFAESFDRFSTVINRHVNRKELPLHKEQKNMRKLKITELNRISAEEFKNILAKILGDKEKFEKEELELYAEIAQNAGGTLNSMFVPSRDEILQIYVESLM